MNKRLKQLLESTQMEEIRQTYLLDTYNQTIYTDFAPTISTRVDASNNIYIMRVIQIGNIVDDSNRNFKNPQVGRVYSVDGIAPCLTCMEGGGREPKIMEAKIIKEGNYSPSIQNLVAEPNVLTPKRTDFGKQVRKQYESGKLDMSRHDMTKLVPRTDGVSNTLTSVQKDNLVAEPKIIKEGNYHPSNHNASSIVNVEGISPTVMENHGTVTAVRIPQAPKTICLNSKVDGKQPSLEDRIYSIEGVMPVCTTSFHPNIAIPQATKQGYIEVDEGGVFDAAYPESTTRRGRVQDGGKVAPTLLTSNELCVYEGVEYKGKKFLEGSGLYTDASDRFQRDGLKDMSRCLKAEISDAGVVQNFRICKLTPRECFRLMGVSEENIDKIQAAGISNSQQYKLAGNSIVVDVLYHIFKKMLLDKGNENQQLTLF